MKYFIFGRQSAVSLRLVLLAVIFGAIQAGGSPSGKILVVGATGSTGFRALQGLLDVGYKPRQIRLLTRNANSDKSRALRKAGFGIVQGNLEEEDSLAGVARNCNCTGCYIHSTSSDTAELDTGEELRAMLLVKEIRLSSRIQHVVYNSAAAQEGHGVARIAQKHAVEDVLERAASSGSFVVTSLRANIFMEEIWKTYTRPQILNGTYPLPVPGNRKLYLVSVRDLGRLAGTLLMAQNQHKTENEDSSQEPRMRKINVAGDYLNPSEMARAFAEAQGSDCYHDNPKWMALKAWWYFPELYEQIRFLQTFTEATNITELHEEFPGVMTTLPEFLAETHWGDRDLTFQDFGKVEQLRKKRRFFIF